MLFKVLSVFALIAAGEALLAYDCNGSKLNMTSISLVTTPECITNKKNITIEEIRIALSQTSVQYEATFTRCNVETINLIGRCGKSIDTFVNKGLFTEIETITKDECAGMIKNKNYRATTDNG